MTKKQIYKKGKASKRKVTVNRLKMFFCLVVLCFVFMVLSSIVVPF